MRKYNSKHIFADVEDARIFVESIRQYGFIYDKCEKNGGAIYINNEGYKLFVCVQ